MWPLAWRWGVRRSPIFLIAGSPPEFIVKRRLSESACWDLFTRMFPNGLDDPAIVRQLTRVERQRLPSKQLADLLGLCLWDVFSHNHEVLTAGGEVVDLGSFRAAAGFIADFRAYRPGDVAPVRETWDYLDFYMGTLGMKCDEQVSAVYELVFSRMRSVGLEWRYVHPRLYLVDFGEWRDEHDSDDATGFERSDPSSNVARELERERRAAQLVEKRALLDSAYRQSAEEARAQPPPDVVCCYRRIYGHFPDGWPPV